MKTYSNITIHHPFSSSVQKEKYLLSYNGQYYEASHAIVELVEELQRYEEVMASSGCESGNSCVSLQLTSDTLIVR